MKSKISMTAENYDKIFYTIHGIYRNYFQEIIGNDHYKLDQMDEEVSKSMGLKYISHEYIEHDNFLLHFKLIDKNKYLMAKIIHGI